MRRTESERLQWRIEDAAYRIQLGLRFAREHTSATDASEQSFSDMNLHLAKWWARKAWHMAEQLESAT